MPTAMASLYPNITTEGYEHFRNDSITDSIDDKFSTTDIFLLKDSDIFHFILYILVRGLMCAGGFVANIICCKVLQIDMGKKHHAATFLLQSLAVADNLVIIFYFAFSIIFGLLPMLGSEEKITSQVIAVYTAVYVIPFVYMARPLSVWITVLIAINRYIAVCRPLAAHRLASLKNTKIQVAVVSILVITFQLPYFFQYTIVFPEGYDFMTVPSLNQTSIGPNTVFGLAFNIFNFGAIQQFLPLFLLIIFNSKIIWELRKVDKWKDTIQQNSGRPENNITVVMVVIIVVFIVCNIPLQIYVVAWCTGDYSDAINGWYVLRLVSNLFLAANSSTNFVVYYILRKSFRQAFRKAFCCYQPQALVV